MFSVSLSPSLSLYLLKRATGCKWEHRRESCDAPLNMEKQSMIYFSPGLCVELYSHHLLCCRKKKGLCWIVFGRAYHWLISFISKLSTSTDVAVLVNFIPSWQHTLRKQPSVFFLLFVYHRVGSQLYNTAISGLTIHCITSVTEWSGK